MLTHRASSQLLQDSSPVLSFGEILRDRAATERNPVLSLYNLETFSGHRLKVDTQHMLGRPAEASGVSRREDTKVKVLVDI